MKTREKNVGQILVEGPITSRPTT